MIFPVCLLCLVFVAENFAYPVSQPVYPNGQYVSAQAIPAVQYRQQPQAYLQPQYISSAAVQTARPVHEPEKGLQRYSTQIKQPIQQVLLNTNVDRQIQKQAVQLGGPIYLQQIQAAQQQAQAEEALAVAQRKATSQTLNRRIQPIPVPQPQPQQQPQPQYIRQLPQPTQVKYARPLAQGYRQIGAEEQRAEQEQNSEDYDPHPSYQFGFDVNDDLYTNYQNRKEQSDGNKITGSYSVVDSDGFVRTVTYTADPKEGFKAEVTRQPTDIVVKIPKHDPQFLKPTQQYVQAGPAHPKARLQPQQQQQQQNPNLVYQYE